MKTRPNLFIAVLALLFAALVLSACGGFAASAPEPDAIFGSGGEVFLAEPMMEEAEFAAAEAPQSFAGDFAANVSAQTVERIVIKNADISIVVPEPAESLDAVGAMAEELGGFVVSSNLFQIQLESGLEVPSANITIRVPAERLNEALERIEAAATRVQSKNQSGQDVTSEYTDLQSRLRNLEEAEEQLREILASASKTEDVLSVFNQLTGVREQIEVIQGQILYFEQSAAFSAISVNLTADAAVQPLSIGGWQPVGVAKDAIQALINALQALANLAIWLLLFALPVLLVILIPIYILIRLALGIYRRRRASSTDTEAEVS